MFIGKVVGKVWCSQQHDDLRGLRYVLVKDVTSSPSSERMLVVVDLIGVADGERALVVTGGTAAKLAKAAVDGAIVGIVDKAAELSD